jgi:hypothetical protein
MHHAVGRSIAHAWANGPVCNSQGQRPWTWQAISFLEAPKGRSKPSFVRVTAMAVTAVRFAPLLALVLFSGCDQSTNAPDQKHTAADDQDKTKTVQPVPPDAVAADPFADEEVLQGIAEDKRRAAAESKEPPPVDTIELRSIEELKRLAEPTISKLEPTRDDEGPKGYLIHPSVRVSGRPGDRRVKDVDDLYCGWEVFEVSPGWTQALLKPSESRGPKTTIRGKLYWYRPWVVPLTEGPPMATRYRPGQKVEAQFDIEDWVVERQDPRVSFEALF